MGNLGEKVDILPGMTARTGVRAIVISFLVIGAVLGLLPLFVVLRSHDWALGTLAFHIWVYVMGCALVNVAAWYGFQMYRANKEIATGYTSLLFNTRAVDVVDTDTGLIVRTKDQKPLESRADLRKARRVALDASQKLGQTATDIRG